MTRLSKKQLILAMYGDVFRGGYAQTNLAVGDTNDGNLNIIADYYRRGFCLVKTNILHNNVKPNFLATLYNNLQNLSFTPQKLKAGAGDLRSDPALFRILKTRLKNHLFLYSRAAPHYSDIKYRLIR